MFQHKIKHLVAYLLCTVLFSSLTQAQVCDADSHNYEHTMNVTGEIVINDVVSENTELIVQAFVGEECRGTAPLSHIAQVDVYIVMLTIYSDNLTGDELTFKIWDGNTAMDCTNSMHFQADAVIGTGSEPYSFTFNTATGLKLVDSGVLNVYPNPSSGNLTITLSEGATDLSYTIYSQSGVSVLSGVENQMENQINLNHLDNGIYFIELVTNLGISVEKIVLEK